MRWAPTEAVDLGSPAGIYTITNAGGAARAVIDLRAATLRYEEGGGGFVSAVNGIAGGFTIAAGVVIEMRSADRPATGWSATAPPTRWMAGRGDDTCLAAAETIRFASAMRRHVNETRTGADRV